MNKKDTKTKIDIKETSPYFDIRKSLKEREIFIVKTFVTILGREPSSRELSFYKYGEMEEKDIIEELLEGEEHKNIVENSKKISSLNRKVEALENGKERLENLISDKAVEYRELGKLLQTKSEEIKKLREKEKNIYNQEKFVRNDSVEDILSEYSFEYNNSYTYTQPTPTRVPLKRSHDIFDKIREILKIE